MSRSRHITEVIQAFWRRVDKSGECWLWTGEVNNQGYGRFLLYEGGATRERILAHRFSAILAGMPVYGPKDVVLHICDTPRCVRPSHLSIGTQKANMRDALAKGRMNMDGLFAPASKKCKTCGVEFVGNPRERYCDPHKPANAGRVLEDGAA